MKYWLLFVLGMITTIGLLGALSEDNDNLKDKAVKNYPNARFLSQVYVSGGASAVFLCEDQELIVVVSDRVFHSSLVHRNESFKCE